MEFLILLFFKSLIQTSKINSTKYQKHKKRKNIFWKIYKIPFFTFSMVKKTVPLTPQIFFLFFPKSQDPNEELYQICCTLDEISNISPPRPLILPTLSIFPDFFYQCRYPRQVKAPLSALGCRDYFQPRGSQNKYSQNGNGRQPTRLQPN